MHDLISLQVSSNVWSNSYMHGLVWPTRLIFLAMGEVLSFGFNLSVSFPSDSRGRKARIVLLPSGIKDGVFITLLELIPLHHVILLNALLRSL